MGCYTACFSNSLKKLASLYQEKVLNPDLFGSDTVVIVQNKNMEEWLKLEIASSRGICAGVSFMFPEQAVRQIIDRITETENPSVKTIVYLDDLKLIIYRQLESIFKKIEKYPEFANLKKYIDTSAPGNDDDFFQARSERLFSLADSIAGLFYHYGQNCPGMTKAWEKGKSFLSGTRYDHNLAHEKWQMTLWNIVFSENSRYTHMGQVVNDIISGRYRVPEGIPDIVVFGSSFLSEQAISFFHYLSRECGINVNHFILSPSPACSGRNSESKSQDGPLASVEKWSEIVKGLARLLSEKKIRTEQYYERPDCPGMLGLLKKTVFKNSLPGVEELAAVSENGSDDSVRVIAASGKKREIEILKDSIIDLAAKGFKFHEIGVAAPDINEYLPFIESVFPASEKSLDIPYNIMDISLAGQSGFIKAFLDIVALCGARFTRKELFRVFSSGSFMERFSLVQEDIEKWLEICSSLSVKWGINSAHRKAVISTTDPSGTWNSALERIAAGIVFGESEEGIELPGSHRVIPWQISDRGIEKKVSVMFAAAESLYHDLYNAGKMEMKPEEWTLFFEKIMDRYLEPVSSLNQEKERSFLKNIFRQINNLGGKKKGEKEGEDENISAGEGEAATLPDGAGEGQGEPAKGRPRGGGSQGDISPGDGSRGDKSRTDISSAESVPFPVFRALLDEYCQAGGYYKGQYLSSGVCFSSLKPLRAVPFRAIFLLGMDMETFPGREKPLSYDLRNVTEQSIDLSRQNTDCFAFLETIISAGEKLVISYNGINPVRGDENEPSVVVSDVADIISSCRKGCMTERYPLFPYDPALFAGIGKTGERPGFHSYDSKKLEAAASQVLPEKLPPSVPCFIREKKPETAGTETAAADVSALALFLKAPLSSFSGTRLGLSSGRIESDENDTNETIGISFIDHLGFTAGIAGLAPEPDFDSFFTALHSRRVLEGKASGSFASWKEYELYRAEISETFRNLESGNYFNAKPAEIFMGNSLFQEGAETPGTIILPAVSADGKLCSLGIGGHISGLRYTDSNGTLDFMAIIYGKNTFKNIIPHLLNYLLLGKSLGDKMGGYTLFNTDGKKISRFSDQSGIDEELSLQSVADSYCFNLASPFVVDVEGIRAAVAAYKKKKNTGEALESIRRHYEREMFRDTRYIESYTRVQPWFDEKMFTSLLENFYFHLDFAAG